MLRTNWWQEMTQTLNNPKGTPLAVGIQLYQTIFLTQLQVTLCLNQQSLPLIVLINCGAERNFLNVGFSLQIGISCEHLETPLEVNTLDGHLLAKVTLLTVPLLLNLSGNPYKRLKFHHLLASYPSIS